MQETATKKGKDYPVGPVLLGFFIFVVIGSCKALIFSFLNLYLDRTLIYNYYFKTYITYLHCFIMSRVS